MSLVLAFVSTEADAEPLQVWLNTTDPEHGVTESADAAEVLFPSQAQARAQKTLKISLRTPKPS